MSVFSGKGWHFLTEDEEKAEDPRKKMMMMVRITKMYEGEEEEGG